MKVENYPDDSPVHHLALVNQGNLQHRPDLEEHFKDIQISDLTADNVELIGLEQIYMYVSCPKCYRKLVDPKCIRCEVDAISNDFKINLRFEINDELKTVVAFRNILSTILTPATLAIKNDRIMEDALNANLCNENYNIKVHFKADNDKEAMMDLDEIERVDANGQEEENN